MILVFGKNGQVAQSLFFDLPKNSIFLSSSECDFNSEAQVLETLNTLNPYLVINAAAYTQVDNAEIEKDSCRKLNAVIPGVIAEWCSKNNTPFVHFSTDYVFNDPSENPLFETSKTNPINYYGLTKLEGEKIIFHHGGLPYIFRVSWVYAPWGKNFPKTISKLSYEREELSIVNDQIGSPTDAREISLFVKTLFLPLIELFDSNQFKSLEKTEKKNLVTQQMKNLLLKPGVYHLCFKDYMSWYDIGLKVFDELKETHQQIKLKKINPINSSAFPTKAQRPLNSRLGTIHPTVKTLCESISRQARKNNWKFLS